MYIFAVATFGLLMSLAVAEDYDICTDKFCDNCPVALSQGGTGYPNCVYYDSKIITHNGKFKKVEGIKTTYWAFNAPFNHGVAVKSFDTTTVQNCGDTPIGCAGTNRCLPIAEDLFQDYFAIEKCHGPEQCANIGCASGARIRPDHAKAAQGGNVLSVVLRYDNGSVIMPAGVVSRETGEDMMHQFRKDFNLDKPRTSRRDVARNEIQSSVEKRGGCHFKTHDPLGYTEPSSNSQLVTASVVGPKGGSISHTVSTTVEFSSTLEAGLTFDIFSASVSFTTSKSHTTESTYTVQVPPGEKGSVYFTPTLICADGMLHCSNQGPRKATGCSAFLPDGLKGVNQGTYAFVSN